jgi:lysophospholipase L1-like esterase
MKHSGRLGVLGCGLAALLLAGCEDGGGGSGNGGDFGNNDPNVYVAMGDSITAGGYPAVLAGMLGKPVINRGVGGAGSADGAARVQGILNSYKPGYLLILYGANDATHGHDPEATIGYLRSIIQTAKANKTVPVIGTLTPMSAEHAAYDAAASSLSAMIRAMAGEEKAAVADLESAFGGRSEYLEADGLHPNAAGTALIAQTFYDAL